MTEYHLTYNKMYYAYEYVVGILWGEEEAEPEPLSEDEEDSLDGSIAGIPSIANIQSNLVIRKSTIGGLKPQQSFRAVPSMIIKPPEPQDNYDASVIAVVLTPAGLILSVFGSIITLLAYTTITGFKTEESIAHTHYGFPVKTGGPLLIVLGIAILVMALVVYMCTPRQRNVPMLYPQVDDEEEEAGQVRVASSRRISVVPVGSKVTPSTSGGVPVQPVILSSGSKVAVMRSTPVV